MKRLFAVLIVCLVPFGFAACGDDDDGPSKADYIEEADAICARSDRETQEIFDAAFEDPSDPQPEEAQEALKAALPIVKKDLEELRGLEEPKDDADEVDAIWTSIDEGIATLEEASADPETSLTALTAEPFAAGERLAGDYGMDDCGPDEG